MFEEILASVSVSAMQTVLNETELFTALHGGHKDIKCDYREYLGSSAVLMFLTSMPISTVMPST